MWKIIVGVLVSVQGFSLVSLPVSGARYIGMGGAFFSISDEPYSIFFNPANLSSVSSYKMSFSYTSGDRFYDSIGFVVPNVKKGSLGIGALRSSNKALYFSYGRKVKDKLSVGGSFKLLKSSDNKRRGIGLDSSLYYPLKPNISLSLILSNFFRDDMGFGGGVSFSYKKYLFSFDIKNKKKTTFHFGLETKRRNVFMRCGFDENSPSIGIGGIISGVNVDLAISHSSIVFSFGFTY
ncbi:TPA: hypothetical protein DCX16_06070 [bacterium]|nr:hypothetical protein [bacterium]